MKCKHCNGTGTTNWCVNGTFVACPYCGGTGEMEMETTNEEWLKSLDTEELAKWLHTAIFDDNFANKIADEAYMNMQTRDDYIEMWLKQPHTPKE